VITGGDSPIVVDTGAPEIDLVHAHLDPTFRRATEHEPRRVLGEAGIDPADVRHVVLTHLHWSHCGNLELFENARFYVQDDELRYAISPIALHRAAYARSGDITPPWLAVLDRVDTIRGAADIAPGVSTVPLPGHTPGSQGVLVETDAGRFLIAGDCLNSYDNWAGGAGHDHIPSSSFTNLIDYAESFARIDSLGCAVIPSHDQRVLDQAVFG
jgi:glyoxylase-like metal-dependent hydrolase (beta-lactamase superfamily II)